jgi:hyaluronoglucosaminidase
MTGQYFDVRGVVEGFYGFFYTPSERMRLIQFLGENDYNAYYYAPKYDRYHREYWREAYPAHTMEIFRQTAQVAEESGVRFSYCLSPGTSICYSSEQDFEYIKNKFLSFYEIGVRDFSLLLDDITPEFSFQEDVDRYTSYAYAHADLCNRVYAWLKTKNEHLKLSMCPTDYAGSAPFSEYTHELGQKLNLDIPIMYTGTQVCSKEITSVDAQRFGEAIGRKPLIWDNYPVNDGGMDIELHIGPIRGRDKNLHKYVAGILVNPMNQAEASKVALATFADYFSNPLNYDPESSWKSALVAVAGFEFSDDLQVIAENSLQSCLGIPEAEKLKLLTNHAIASIQNGSSPETDPDVIALETYLNRLSSATYRIVNDCPNTALRNELIPWLEKLENWVFVGKNTIRALRVAKDGGDNQKILREIHYTMKNLQKNPKRMMGEVLKPFAELVFEPSDRD